MHPGLRELSLVLPQYYDELLIIRSHCINNGPVQTLAALFFVGSLFISAALFIYWCFCAWHVLNAQGLELTGAEIEPMRWDRKIREHLWYLFSSNRSMLGV